MSKLQDTSTYTPPDASTWLNALLDSYAICEEEMNQEMASEQVIRGQEVACAKGCYHCCIGYDVPVTPPESLGISWYVTEVMAQDDRIKLYERLEHQEDIIGCPFLIEGNCSVHPVRPLACRKFIVYGDKCKSSKEDPFFSRPGDMHPSFKERNLRIAMRFLDSPVYNLPTTASKLTAYRNGLMHESTPSIHTIRWSGFINATEDMIF